MDWEKENQAAFTRSFKQQAAMDYCLAASDLADKHGVSVREMQAMQRTVLREFLESETDTAATARPIDAILRARFTDLGLTRPFPRSTVKVMVQYSARISQILVNGEPLRPAKVLFLLPGRATLRLMKGKTEVCRRDLSLTLGTDELVNC